jgi:hypothetical protein
VVVPQSDTKNMVLDKLSTENKCASCTWKLHLLPALLHSQSETQNGKQAE